MIRADPAATQGGLRWFGQLRLSGEWCANLRAGIQASLEN
jgi:hypothetical protein